MGRWRGSVALGGVPVTAPDHGHCAHCPKPRGVHLPDCPNYFTGNSLVGVPVSVPPPDSTDTEPEGS